MCLNVKHLISLKRSDQIMIKHVQGISLNNQFLLNTFWTRLVLNERRKPASEYICGRDRSQDAVEEGGKYIGSYY